MDDGRRAARVGNGGQWMATIVGPRPDGAVAVFAGTGSASAIEALATRALPRADDALRDPAQSAITSTPGA